MDLKSMSPFTDCLIRRILWLLIVLALQQGVMGQTSQVTPDLRERAVKTLRDALAAEQGWVKVHAAEFLLALDYSQGVRETYAKELEMLGDEPQYRIGIWRVMAQAAQDESQRIRWQRKIRDAFLDIAGPDRLQAAEALGRLGYKPEENENGVFAEAAKSSPDPNFAVCAQWVLADSGKAEDERRLAAFLNSPREPTRMRAACALRFLQTVSDETRQKLIIVAEQEPASSSARACVLSTALVHSSEPKNARRLKEELLKCAQTGSKNDKCEAAAALAAKGGVSDLSALVALLDDPEADVRVNAANAVLRIGRRGSAHFGATDWFVVAVYGLGMLAVGYYYMRKNKTTDDYLLGGRHMKSWAVGLSLFAALLSTLSYLALPGEIIKNGPMYLCALASYPLIAYTVGWHLIPYIMRLKVTSAYEILDLRLGPSARLLGAVLFLMLRLLWMAAIIYATSDKVLIPLLGWPQSAAPWVYIVLSVVTLAYTTMGGLQAVVWTDVLQTLILFAGAIAILLMITVSMGGVGAWWPGTWPPNWEIPKFGFQTEGRITFGWMVLSDYLWYVCTTGSDQMAIQRYLSTRDAKSARRALIWSLGAAALIFLLLATLGLALLAYFTANPHTLTDGQRIVANADQLFPCYVTNLLPAGMGGLVVAGMLAAAMSSLSAGVNSASSVITVDFVDHFRRRKMNEAQHVKMARYISVIIGALVVSISFYIGLVHGNLFELCYRVVNLFTAPLFILFFMAMFVPWATAFGAGVGTVCAMAVAIAIAFWEFFTGQKGPSFLWIMPLSLLAGVVAGMIASLLPLGAKPKLSLAELKIKTDQKFK